MSSAIGTSKTKAARHAVVNFAFALSRLAPYLTVETALNLMRDARAIRQILKVTRSPEDAAQAVQGVLGRVRGNLQPYGFSVTYEYPQIIITKGGQSLTVPTEGF